jgi:hypothetical protein
MRRIPLTQNQFVIVDDSDFPLHSEFKWCYRAERNLNQGYAVRHGKVDGKDRLIYLHRLLMNPPKGYEVIFLNHDRLDCRRENLRVVTKEEARQHHRVRNDSATGIKGVRYSPYDRTWSAYICRNGTYHNIGTFYRQVDAQAAYEEALRRENPDLHSAPPVVDREAEFGTDRQNPDARPEE